MAGLRLSRFFFVHREKCMKTPTQFILLLPQLLFLNFIFFFFLFLFYCKSISFKRIKIVSVLSRSEFSFSFFKDNNVHKVPKISPIYSFSSSCLPLSPAPPFHFRLAAYQLNSNIPSAFSSSY